MQLLLAKKLLMIFIFENFFVVDNFCATFVLLQFNYLNNQLSKNCSQRSSACKHYFDNSASPNSFFFNCPVDTGGMLKCCES